MTSDEHHLVCYDADKLKPNLYIHRFEETVAQNEHLYDSA